MHSSTYLIKVNQHMTVFFLNIRSGIESVVVTDIRTRSLFALLNNCCEENC